MLFELPAGARWPTEVHFHGPSASILVNAGFMRSRVISMIRPALFGIPLQAPFRK